MSYESIKIAYPFVFLFFDNFSSFKDKKDQYRILCRIYHTVT